MATPILFRVKGDRVPAEQLSEESLQWYAEKCSNSELREAARAERQRRSTEKRRRDLKLRAGRIQAVLKRTRNPRTVTDQIKKLSEFCHVIAPSRSCAALPDGFEVTISTLYADGADDTYAIEDGDGFGLHKATLDAIARVANVTWLPDASGRRDDRANPHYVEWQAAGRWRMFDGSEHTEVANVALDLRDGAPRARDQLPHVLERQRRFILEIAESRAKNRVIRSLGVRESYSEADLQRPFAILRLGISGKVDDPELRRAISLRTLDAMQGTAIPALYGPEPKPERAAPPPAAEPPPEGKF